MGASPFFIPLPAPPSHNSASHLTAISSAAFTTYATSSSAVAAQSTNQPHFPPQLSSCPIGFYHPCNQHSTRVEYQPVRARQARTAAQFLVVNPQNGIGSGAAPTSTAPHQATNQADWNVGDSRIYQPSCPGLENESGLRPPDPQPTPYSPHPPPRHGETARKLSTLSSRNTPTSTTWSSANASTDWGSQHCGKMGLKP